MSNLRPSVKEDDGYIEKIIKYIPAEIIAGYTALVGYLSINTVDIPPNYKIYYLILLIILIIITPIWTYYAVIDNADTIVLDMKKKRALFHSIIATFAFIIWVYAIGNPLLKAILCNCTNTTCTDCLYYSPALGSIILVMFTILAPLMERIILGKGSIPNN